MEFSFRDMRRRDFFGVFTLAGISLFVNPVFGNENNSSIQQLEDVLGEEVEGTNWKPLEVTQAFLKEVDEKGLKFKEDRGPYPDKKWIIQQFAPEPRDRDYHKPPFKGECGEIFLCKDNPRRIYSLGLEEDKNGNKSKSPIYSGYDQRIQVAENGVIVYGFGDTPYSRKSILLANINTGKKLTFKTKNGIGYFELSESGNRLIIGGIVMNTDDYKIVDKGLDKRPITISYDGKYTVVTDGFNDSYYLKDIDNQKLTEITERELTKVDWVISRNNRYCACARSHGWGTIDFDLEVIDVEKKDNFIITPESRYESPRGISNNGTLYTYHNKYECHNGKYVLAKKDKSDN